MAIAALRCMALAPRGLALRGLRLPADRSIRGDAAGPPLPSVVRLAQAFAVDLPFAINYSAHFVVHLRHEFSPRGTTKSVGAQHLCG